MGKIAGNLLMSAVALTAMAVASPQAIAAEEKREYHLPAQDLGTSLRAIGSASHREIMFQAQSVEGRRAPALDGTYTASEAVEILLRDTGLVASTRGRVRQGGVISAVAVGHRQAALAVMCRG
jgi:hypothetical protein